MVLIYTYGFVPARGVSYYDGWPKPFVVAIDVANIDARRALLLNVGRKVGEIGGQGEAKRIGTITIEGVVAKVLSQRVY